MPAGNYDLTIEQGTDFAVQVVVKNGDDPIDLTGMTAAAQVRSEFSSPRVQLDFTIDNGGADGTLLLSATAAETQAMSLERGDGVWDLELTDSGVVTRVLQGHVFFKPEVTRE